MLLSAWKEIPEHQAFGYADTVEKVIIRSISLGRDDEEVTLKAKSFKKDDSESPIDKFDSLNNGGDSKELKLEASDSFKQLAFEQGNANSVVSNDKANRIVIPINPP